MVLQPCRLDLSVNGRKVRRLASDSPTVLLWNVFLSANHDGFHTFVFATVIGPTLKRQQDFSYLSLVVRPSVLGWYKWTRILEAPSLILV